MQYVAWCPIEGCRYWGKQLKKAESEQKARLVVYNHIVYGRDHKDYSKSETERWADAAEIGVWNDAKSDYDIIQPQAERRQRRRRSRSKRGLDAAPRSPSPPQRPATTPKFGANVPAPPAGAPPGFPQQPAIMAPGQALDITAVIAGAVAACTRSSGNCSRISRPLPADADDSEKVSMSRAHMKAMHDSILRASHAANQCERIANAAGDAFRREVELLESIAGDLEQQIG